MSFFEHPGFSTSVQKNACFSIETALFYDLRPSEVTFVICFQFSQGRLSISLLSVKNIPSKKIHSLHLAITFRAKCGKRATSKNTHWKIDKGAKNGLISNFIFSLPPLKGKLKMYCFLGSISRRRLAQFFSITFCQFCQFQEDDWLFFLEVTFYFWGQFQEDSWLNF